MTALIFLAVFAAGAIAGSLVLVVLAIRREDSGTGLPERAPSLIAAAGRLITGLRVREMPSVSRPPAQTHSVRSSETENPPSPRPLRQFPVTPRPDHSGDRGYPANPPVNTGP